MKKHLLLIALASAIFASCSKNAHEELTETEEKLHEVSFNSPQIRQSQHLMSASLGLSQRRLQSEGVNSAIKQILLVVCNENHFPLFSSIKSESEPFNFKLKNGKYVVKVFATTFGQSDSKLVKDGNSVALYLPNSPFVGYDGQNYLSYRSGEVFLGHRTIDVIKDSTYSTMILDRLSSKIELNVTDTAPPDLAYFEIHTDIGHVLIGGVGSSPFEGNRYPGNTVVPNNKITYSIVSDAGEFAGNANFVIPFDLVTKGQTIGNLQEKTGHVTIRAYNSSNQVVSVKILENIKLVPNTITRLTGNMFESFNGEKQGELNISYNNSYTENSPTYNF